MSKEKTKKKTALEQSTINMRLYRFCARLFKVVGKIRYGFKVDKSAIKGLKGPFLVLGNHTSWVDFLQLRVSAPCERGRNQQRFLYEVFGEIVHRFRRNTEKAVYKRFFVHKAYKTQS